MNEPYYVHPLEYLMDDEERWCLTGKDQVSGWVENEETLEEIRESCRWLALTNEFAINGHENRISFIVGSGHGFFVESRPGRDVSDRILQKTQDCLDEFIEENQWYERQQEIVRRKDRDGEAFLRLFADSEGKTSIRFVEPEEIQRPDGVPEEEANISNRLGIQTLANDVEHVLGYWVHGVWVPAEEIQHRKANVDFNVRRGLPIFFPVRKNLRRAEKLLRNMSVVAEIQSAIAIIRKHQGTSRLGIESFASRNADGTFPTTNGKTLYRHYSPGTILDTSSGVDYEFPVAAVDASRYVTVLQAELRAIASRLVMPEFMLTSDASNANYASTMIAEGPAVRMFERLQHEMIREDRRLLGKVLRHAVVAGRLEPEVLTDVRIQITPPGLSVHDRLKEVQADKLLVELGAMSPQELASRHGCKQMNT
ncbi:MAG: phage portal protein [Planctomycetia bacterium]|nr:phage portal protein [Planctomycetia bacterium]